MPKQCNYVFISFQYIFDNIYDCFLLIFQMGNCIMILYVTKKELERMLPPIIEFLKDKSVLILGFGREGRSTYNYIRKYPHYLPSSFMRGVAEQSEVGGS